MGFLATGQGPDDFHGNFGILDQRLSIAWLKANIQSFGGDPDQVCLVLLFKKQSVRESISINSR